MQTTRVIVWMLRLLKKIIGSSNIEARHKVVFGYFA